MNSKNYVIILCSIHKWKCEPKSSGVDSFVFIKISILNNIRTIHDMFISMIKFPDIGISFIESTLKHEASKLSWKWQRYGVKMVGIIFSYLIGQQKQTILLFYSFYTPQQTLLFHSEQFWKIYNFSIHLKKNW